MVPAGNDNSPWPRFQNLLRLVARGQVKINQGAGDLGRAYGVGLPEPGAKCLAERALQCVGGQTNQPAQRDRAPQ